MPDAVTFSSYSSAPGLIYSGQANSYGHKLHSLKTFASGLGNNLVKALPAPISEVVQSSSVGAGLSQIAQEFLFMFVPKTSGSLFIRHSGLMVAYEMLLELVEYVGLYLLPTFLAASLASFWMKRTLKLPDFRLLGEPYWKLEKNLNKEYSVGKFKGVIDRKLLNKLALGKLLTFVAAAGAGCATQVMAPLPRVLFAKQLFNTDNFFAISGLQVAEEELKGSEESERAIKQGWKNLWASSAYLFLSIPAIMGLSHFLGKRMSNDAPKWLNRAAKHFDMGEKFGISKMCTTFNLAVAPWAYMSVSFNEAERLENRDCLLLFAIPEVLFFKQLMGNLLCWLGGLASGAGNILMNPKTALNEFKEGKRELFDLSLVNKEHILSLQKVKAMSPEKQEKLLKTVELMDHKVVYGMALVCGFLLNWLNYLRTAHMHNQQMKEDEEYDDDRFEPSNSASNNIVPFSRGLTTEIERGKASLSQSLLSNAEIR